jgi:Glycine zipper
LATPSQIRRVTCRFDQRINSVSKGGFDMRQKLLGFRTAILALICAICFATTGCYTAGFTPRETGTVGGAALGAGGGALIGSTVGSPGTGAVLGGLGGGLAGYLIGNSVQEQNWRYNRGYY